jgi:ankyrin repeat protein
MTASGSSISYWNGGRCYPVMKSFVQHDADPDAMSKTGSTALLSAIQNGRMNVIKYLIGATNTSKLMMRRQQPQQPQAQK